jgi:hypothetical protein
VPFPSFYGSINPCFIAGKISGVGNCHAAWRHRKKTVCTSIVYDDCYLGVTSWNHEITNEFRILKMPFIFPGKSSTCSHASLKKQPVDGLSIANRNFSEIAFFLGCFRTKGIPELCFQAINKVI